MLCPLVDIPIRAAREALLNKKQMLFLGLAALLAVAGTALLVGRVVKARTQASNEAKANELAAIEAQMARMVAENNEMIRDMNQMQAIGTQDSDVTLSKYNNHQPMTFGELKAKMRERNANGAKDYRALEARKKEILKTFKPSAPVPALSIPDPAEATPVTDPRASDPLFVEAMKRIGCPVATGIKGCNRNTVFRTEVDGIKFSLNAQARFGTPGQTDANLMNLIASARETYHREGHLW